MSGLPPEELAASLGLRLGDSGSLSYAPDYRPPVGLSCGLVMVPHGKTPANEKHLFQSHSDGPHSQLTAEGVAMAEQGALAFAEEYGATFRDHPDGWPLYRSPLTRTAATALPYLSALRSLGLEVPEPTEDTGLLEITHGSWDGRSVDDLEAAGHPDEAAEGRRYRDGSFAAKALDGSGESKLEVIARAAEWLKALEARHGGQDVNVLAFGHGTFQNSVELLLRCLPELAPEQLFNRNPTGGSHIRRGRAHILAPLRGAAARPEPAA